MDIEMLEFRAAVFDAVRGFFKNRGYLETDTPLLSPDLIPETCLEVFETAYLRPGGEKGVHTKPCWLVPSPEIWMKKLIARHGKNIFQICRCFRNGESTGHLHSPEFTMLEWYTMGADFLDSLDLAEKLFLYLAEETEKYNPFAGNEILSRILPPFTRITVAEAFERYAGIPDLHGAAENGLLENHAKRLGLEIPAGTGAAEIYDLIFIHAVEPRLCRRRADRPVALTEYPAFVPCLAKLSPDGKTRERWELYFDGVELANCFSEETGAETVRAFFEKEGAEKDRSALVPHARDDSYWKTFLPRGGRPWPECSGVATGMDRLIMSLTGRRTIDAVLPFPMNPIRAASEGSPQNLPDS